MPGTATPFGNVVAAPSMMTSYKLTARVCIHLSIHKSIQKVIQHDAYSL